MNKAKCPFCGGVNILFAGGIDYEASDGKEYAVRRAICNDCGQVYKIAFELADVAFCTQHGRVKNGVLNKNN